MQDTDNKMQVHSIATEIASCFSVFRDQVIRHWDYEDFQDDSIGTVNNPFDLKYLEIDPKTLINVAKLLTKDHKLLTCLNHLEV